MRGTIGGRGRVEHGSTGTTADSGARADQDARWRFLRGEVDRQLALFGRRRRRDKRKAFALQMATVTLAATVTVLLGLRTSDTTRTLLLNIALVLGALITVLAAAEAFFTHRRLWVLRTATVRRLETLSRHVDFNAAGASGRLAEESALAACLAELDAIIADDLKAWHHLHESPPSAHETRLPGAAGPARPEEAQRGVGAGD
jgi:hypothetical protein